MVKAQIVIVGAGPTGAALARLLAQRQIRVTLIEASRDFRRIFRGQALMPSGLEAIAQMGLSSAVETIPQMQLDAWEFWIEGKRLFRVDEPILDPASASSKRPCTLVSQPEFLAALVQQAEVCPGFDFVQGKAVQSLMWEQGRVTGVRLADGQAIAADLVIATDGRKSTLREEAGLRLQENSPAADILWFSLKDAPPLRNEKVLRTNVFYAVIKNGQSFGLFRSAQGDLQLGWGLNPSASGDWQRENWPKVLAEHSPAWLANYFRANANVLSSPVRFRDRGTGPRWSVPGLLLLGDAAHPMSPIRAQGINMALRDAIVAANHLVPLGQSELSGAALHRALDQALGAIQAEREPEIVQSQALQAEEWAQGEKLRRYPILRWGASQFAPLVGWGVRRAWLQRQQQLRLGVAPVEIKV
ncbi:MAG: NAD(P)-binding protein [Synechococcales cyanobacterium RU_4_20]|nr:NAD(P)-binding protein [Synechococcales cyanobacterium RU_4_20]